MVNKVFSGIDKLPLGYASDDVTKGCLVLEGGAFRGVYSEGIIDLLQQENINFECTVGVSAGALNGVNYVSGQIGRSARVNLRYRHDERYVGLKPLVRDRGVIGFDFVFGELDYVEPFDYKRFYDPKWKFVAVTSCLETASTEYFDNSDKKNIFTAVRASASMPFISEPVLINNKHFLDGGCTCNIPYQWAIDQGYEKIIVIKTRNSDYRDPPRTQAQANIIRRLYRDYPEFAEELIKSDKRYNNECDEIDYLEKIGRIFVFRPSEPIDVGRLETDMEKLGDLYYLGRKDGLNNLKSLKNYLNK